MDKTINTPLVSVIMPAYNAENYIQESIDSVIFQTHTNWELIIIDDGSTDSTSLIISKNCRTDSRIKSFYQKNGKQGKARNLGITIAQGFYIAFLDADDLWMSEKLEIQLEEINKKNVDLVFSDSYIFDGTISNSCKKMNTPNLFFKGQEGLKLFLEGNRIPILTVFVKKEKIVLVNGFSEKKSIQNAEDYHLWLKMLISGCTFYGSQKVLSFYRIHSASSTSQDKLASRQIPEVFYDLFQNNPELKKIIFNNLKKHFQKQYNRLAYSKSEFYFVVDQNCFYLNKQNYAPFFKFINFFLGIKITKKILNQFLNV